MIARRGFKSNPPYSNAALKYLKHLRAASVSESRHVYKRNASHYYERNRQRSLAAVLSTYSQVSKSVRTEDMSDRINLRIEMPHPERNIL